MHDANGWAGLGLVLFKVCRIPPRDYEAHSDVMQMAGLGLVSLFQSVLNPAA